MAVNDTKAFRPYSKRQSRWYFRLMLWLVSWLYWLVSNTYFRTMRITVVGKDIFDRFNNQARKAITVPWHCYVPFGLWMARNLKVAIMASRSNFGSVAAAITARMGCIPVRGGSRKGGKEALEEIVRYAEEGHWTLIVGDAPRGPIFECKIGPILAAQRTGLPIIPISFGARWKWTLGTWDKSIIPKPFSRIVWVYGEPFYVPKDLDREGLEEKRRELERILRENHEKAQHFWDRTAAERR
jgi:lysophospholipid acyltransferase (LPLAT)-like uncharacterized protein